MKGFDDLRPHERAVVAAANEHLEEIGVGPRFNRRWFLETAVAGAATAALAGCGVSTSSSSSKATKAATGVANLPHTGKLNGFTYAFFTDKKQYADYKQQYGYIPNWSIFDPPGTRQIPKLKSHPGLYDLVVLSSNVSKFFMEADVLQPWDVSAIPNYAKVFQPFRTFDNSLTFGKPYEIASFWGHNSVAYNTELVSAQDGSTLRSLFDPRFEGKIAMQNQPPESFAIAGLYLGVKNPFHMTEDEYKRAAEVLVKQKPLVRAYWTQLGELGPLFDRKEVTIAWAWPPIEGMVKDAKVKFVDQLKEGGTGWDTGWGLAKAAKNVYEAHVYVNWELSAPRIEGMAALNFASASSDSLKVLSKKQIDAFHLQQPEQFLNSLAFQEFHWKNELISNLWQEVQTA